MLRGEHGVMFGRRFPLLPSATVTGHVIYAGGAVPAIRPDLALGSRVVATAHHAAFTEINVLHDNVSCLANETPDEVALLARLGAVAQNAVRLVEPNPPKSGLIFGLGLLGQIVLRTAHLAGSSSLSACDPHGNRRAAAEKVNGVATFDLGDPLPTADAVFIVCTGEVAIRCGLSAAAESGTIVLVGAGVAPVTVDLGRHVFRRDVRIIGAHERFADVRPGRRDNLFAAGLHFISNSRFDPADLGIEQISARDLAAAYSNLLLEKDRYIGLAVYWSAGD